MVDTGYVEFEFIGERQHLKERGFTRGANCTSIDAVMIGRLSSGVLCMFLIEWKYTEAYTNTDMYIPKRSKVYDDLISLEASPFKFKNQRAYYFEPFYQLMRQTLLGWQLCEHCDHGCTEYRHVHVVPEGNKDLLENVTSTHLREFGRRISEVWRSVLKNPELFISTTPEKLLAPLAKGADSAAFLAYLRRRYWGPRCNRVTPFGEFIATDARGAFMGNRGILHNQNGELGRRKWEHKTWVTCALSFKGRVSPINAPGMYTQLFFLDEATAFASGHRPCGECRRGDFTRFKEAWLKGNGHHGFHDTIKVHCIDTVIHEERVVEADDKPQMHLSELPDGVMVALPDSRQPWLLWKGSLHRWTPQGYADSFFASRNQLAKVLTPASIVQAIKAGYTPSVLMEMQEEG